jgi:hypothetical protein
MKSFKSIREGNSVEPGVSEINDVQEDPLSFVEIKPKKTKVVKEDLQEAVSVKKEKHSWGTMMTVHHGSDTSYPLHPEHQSAIKKLRPGMKTTFKDETNATVHAHREGDTVHLIRPKTGSTLTSLPYHHFDTSEHAKPAAKKPAGEYDRKVTAHLKKKYNEETEQMAESIDFNKIWNSIKPVEEEVKTTHEDPLVVTKDAEGHIHTHANLSVANAIHGTDVKHQAIHTKKPVQAGKFTFELSKHHEGALKEDAPFDPVAHKKELDRLMGKHIEAHKAMVAAPKEDYNKAQDKLNAVKAEIRAHKDKVPAGPAPKPGSAAHYYASKKPGEYTGD